MRLCKLFTPILLSLSVFSLASCGGANNETKVITEEEYKTKLEEKAGVYGFYPECTTDYKRVILGTSKTVRTTFEGDEPKEEVEEYLGKLETFIDYDNQIIHVDTYENDLLEMHQVYYQQDDKFFYYYPASDFTREENTSFSSMAPYYFKEYMEYTSSYSNTFSILCV